MNKRIQMMKQAYDTYNPQNEALLNLETKRMQK